MTAEEEAGLARRAVVHRALGDPLRLAIVDALVESDRTPGELREMTGADWNLLAFHLHRLEKAGVAQRRTSEGDGRRRYVRLRAGVLEDLRRAPSPPALRSPLFVCTHNSARSLFAAALWRRATNGAASSAGTDPAATVHPLAVAVAAAWGLDLADARPRGYDAVTLDPGVVVSVCDRAREAGVPFDAPRLHWSVPDPSGGSRATFEVAFADIAERVSRLAPAAA